MIIAIIITLDRNIQNKKISEKNVISSFSSNQPSTFYPFFGFIRIFT